MIKETITFKRTERGVREEIHDKCEEKFISDLIQQKAKEIGMELAKREDCMFEEDKND
jgi:hypothetical protein